MASRLAEEVTRRHDGHEGTQLRTSTSRPLARRARTRIEEVQDKGTGEGGYGGPHDRLGAERETARDLRFRRPEEDRDGGGPASTQKAIPEPDPQTSQDPGAAFFNTLAPSTKFATPSSTQATEKIPHRGDVPRVAKIVRLSRPEKAG